MRSILLAGVAAAWVSVVTAQSQVLDSPIRMGNQLIRVGDSKARVLAAAKMAPTMKETIENALGGAVGERWTYIEEGYSGRIVTIEFYGGVVDRLWSERLK